MSKYKGYIKARLKTLKQMRITYPPARFWGKPINSRRLFPSADEAIIPFLGKIVWVKKK